MRCALITTKCNFKWCELVSSLEATPEQKGDQIQAQP
jgi:hypothetical protein